MLLAFLFFEIISFARFRVFEIYLSVSRSHGHKVFKVEREGVNIFSLRYAQADALVSSLLQYQTMSDLSLTERNYVLDRIRSEIMGRMMEDIVLLETTLANPKKQVFVLQFAVGEFDMVVFDPAAASCEIFEIMHSAEIVLEQARHLIDPEKCAMTEHRYGAIKKKTVLYRGATQDVNGIRYVNVEEDELSSEVQQFLN